MAARSMRAAGVLIALSFTLVIVLVANDARAATHKVIVPDGDNLQYLGFWVAKGAGYFRDESIELEMVVPPVPAMAIAWVNERRADVAILPPPVYIELISQKFPLVLVANLLASDPINLVVRRSVFESRHLDASAPIVDRLRALTGLKVGVAPGPPPRLRALFAAVGLDADKDIEMVVVRGPDQNRAFADGKFDVMYCHTPYLEKALVEQDALMLVNQSGGEVPELAMRQIHALVVTRDFARDRRDAVQSMVHAIARGERLVHEDAKRAVEAILTEFPAMDRRHVETIVRLYAPAVPKSPRVSVDGIAPALALFPSSRTKPSLEGIDLAPFVANEFAAREESALVTKAEAPPPAPWWRGLVRIAAIVVTVVVTALVFRARRRAR